MGHYLHRNVEHGVALYNATSDSWIVLLGGTYRKIPGWIVADAVQFESVMRHSDGTHATSVALQGQDGTILLNDLPIKMYFPLAGKGRS